MIGATYRCKAFHLGARPRRQRPGHLVAQATAGGYQRQPAHHCEFGTDLGGGPPGDRLVQVRLADGFQVASPAPEQLQTFPRESGGYS
jgi:hypothetical protein